MLCRCLSPLLLAVAVQAQTSVFTYQGYLSDGGVSANGSYDLRFTLHDAAASGGQVGGTINLSPVLVSNGVFTVALDFGAAAFDGNSRWLQIAVRSFGDTNQHTVLAPRQFLASTPYSVRAIHAADAATAASATALSAPLPATNISGILPDARLSNNIPRLNLNAVFLGSVTATQFNGSGAGLSNLPATGLTGTLPDARLSPNVPLLSGDANFSGNVSAASFSGNGVGLTNVPGRIFETIPTAAPIQAVANTGYLATNETAPVVVTLPASANIRVGETVRVSGSGAGGWVIAQNAGQSILVANLQDTVGQTWATRDSARSWKCLAASADGRKLVAAVAGGQMFTSTDYGATWTGRYLALGWQSVASSGDGTKLVAVTGGAGGQIFTSTDSGTNWAPHPAPPAPSNWSSVASSLDGVNLVATINAGPIYTSSNSGGTWTLRDTTRLWTSVASSASGVYLVAAVQGGMIYTSTNSGATWTPRDSNRSWVSVASSADGSRLAAAVSSGQLYVSPDTGANWYAVGPATPINWTSVASSADGSRMAAVYTSGGLYVSTDSGTTWAPRASLPPVAWTGVAFSGDGSTLVAVATASPIYVSSQAATTVGTAGALTGTRQAAVELQYLGNGLFMPISFVGTIRAR